MQPESSHPFAHVSFTGGERERMLYRKMFSVAIAGGAWERIEDAEIIMAALEPVVDEATDWNLRSFEFHCMSALSAGGSADYAVRRMTQRLHDDPDDELATLMMVTALRNVGDLEWEFMAACLLATSADPFVRDVARSTLENEEAARIRRLTRDAREARAVGRSLVQRCGSGAVQSSQGQAEQPAPR
jgi:hypothetical protein